MEYFIVAVVSLLISPLTLYSGFGLGTLLLPGGTLPGVPPFGPAGTLRACELGIPDPASRAG